MQRKCLTKFNIHLCSKKKKPLQKVGIERVYLNTAKAIYEKSTGNIFSTEKLKAFPIRSGIRQWRPLLPLLFNSFGSPSFNNQRRKTKKKNPD